MKLNKMLSVAAVSLFAVQAPAHAEMSSITIGTNPSGSTFYLIGSAFARLFQEELSIRTTVQPFAGSSVYLPAIDVGDVTLGLSSTVDSSLAYTGSAGYPQEIDGLRAIAAVWRIPYAFITRADSGIVTADDLRGRSIMGDMPTSQALTQINTAIVHSGGLTLEDVDFMPSGGLMDGINAVVEGRADAAPVATAMPILRETQASVSGGLRIVANGSAGTDAFFGSEVTGVSVMTAAPNERRPFVIGDTPIVVYDTLLVADDSMSDDDAYMITQTLYENWAELQENVGPLRGVAQDALALTAPSVPYHSGAIRFFREIGLWTDAHEAAQARF